MLKENIQLQQKLIKTLEAVEEKMSEGQWEEANSLLKIGIERLGRQYFQIPLLDDTSLRLTLAQSEDAANNFQTAAHIRYTILDSRMSIFQRKIDGQTLALNAENDLTASGKLIALKQFERANNLLKESIEKIGNKYKNPLLKIDPSKEDFSSAILEEETNDFEASALLFSRVLGFRARQLKDLFQD
jgi:hypothetical protein